MNRTLKFSVVCVLLVICIIGGSFASKFINKVKLDKGGYYKSTYAKISTTEWKRVNSEYSQYDNPKEFLLAIDNYVRIVQTHLGAENWIEELKNENGDKYDTTIEVVFTYHFSRAIGGNSIESQLTPKLKLNIPSFEENREPLLHELTHLISPLTKSSSLSEGLACYMQDGFGENNAYSHKSGIDKYLISEYYYMFQYLGVKDTTEVQDIMFSNEDDLYAFLCSQ